MTLKLNSLIVDGHYKERKIMSFKEQYKRAKEIVEADELWYKNWKSKADFMNDKFPDMAAKGPTWSQRINAARKLLKDIEESLFHHVQEDEEADEEVQDEE
jgi:hypothetical protein